MRACFAALAVGLGGARLAAAAEPAVDDAAAQLARDLLLDTHPDRTGPAPSALPAELAAWAEYVAALHEPDPQRRERSLRRVLRRSPPLLLRGVVVQTIGADPAFRSRQALFIRRYGFYASWFNRLAYSASRIVQGNVQAAAQLAVEAAHDLIRGRDPTPEDRRAYRLLQQTAPGAPQGRADAELRERLARRVRRALAAEDQALAEWWLANGAPEAAWFYAQQALELDPQRGAARRLAAQAESMAAAHRRAEVVSRQVGYPDRNPPVELAPPEQLRALLIDSPASLAAQATGARGNGAALFAALGALPPDGRGLDLAADRWPAAARQARASEAERAWLRAVASDPQLNPAVRLERARARQRGRLWRYVVFGPERPREQAYEAASLLVQSYDWLRDLGFFYGFEVIARLGEALARAPVPDDALRDAQAVWLRSVAADPPPRARDIARDLMEAAVRRGAFDEARALVERWNLGASEAATIDRAEARALLQTAESLPDGAARRALLERAVRLAPDARTVRRADALRMRVDAAPQPVRWTVAREALVAWQAGAAAGGLPVIPTLPPAWLDGDPRNGELGAPGVEVTYYPAGPGEPNAEAVAVRAPVRFPDGTRWWQERLAADRWPPELRRWLEVQRALQAESTAARDRFERLPVPFALEGGAGPSGVDLYPKLLPIEPTPGERDLYR